MKPLGLEMLDPLSARNFLEDVPFLILPVGGDDVRDRAAPHLLGTKAEDSFHALIPA